MLTLGGRPLRLGASDSEREVPPQQFEVGAVPLDLHLGHVSVGFFWFVERDQVSEPRTGTVTVNTAPNPSSLSAPTVPPCRSTISRTMKSPS